MANTSQKKRMHPSGVVYVFGKYGNAKKAEIGYESNPPSCRNCYAFTHAHYGGNGHPERPHYCLKHQLLLTEKTGICDTWESKTGEKLE